MFAANVTKFIQILCLSEMNESKSSCLCVWFNCIHLLTWLVQSTKFHLLTLKRSDTDHVNPNPGVKVSDLELIKLYHIPRTQIAIDGETEISQVKVRLPLTEGCF